MDKTEVQPWELEILVHRTEFESKHGRDPATVFDIARDTRSTPHSPRSAPRRGAAPLVVPVRQYVLVRSRD